LKVEGVGGGEGASADNIKRGSKGRTSAMLVGVGKMVVLMCVINMMGMLIAVVVVVVVVVV